MQSASTYCRLSSRGIFSPLPQALRLTTTARCKQASGNVRRWESRHRQQKRIDFSGKLSNLLWLPNPVLVLPDGCLQPINDKCTVNTPGRMLQQMHNSPFQIERRNCVSQNVERLTKRRLQVRKTKACRQITSMRVICGHKAN